MYDVPCTKYGAINIAAAPSCFKRDWAAVVFGGYIKLVSTHTATTENKRILGNKQYELSNHLGNVNAEINGVCIGFNGMENEKGSRQETLCTFHPRLETRTREDEDKTGLLKVPLRKIMNNPRKLMRI